MNCSQHIQARLTVDEVERMATTIQERYAELQAENARLRGLLAERQARPISG